MSLLTQDEQREVGMYEDLRVLANRMIWTIELQVRRLRGSDQTDDFVLRPVSDAEFLVLCLDRFITAARRIDELTNGVLARELREFDVTLPNLRAARNVVAHIDEYLAGIGKNQSVRIGQVSTHVVDSNRLSFAGFEFNLDATVAVVSKTFAAIRENPPTSYFKATSSSAQ